MSRTSNIRVVPINNSGARGPDTMFVVDLLDNDKLVETRKLPGKGIHYAMDVSENWDNGIIKEATNEQSK